MKIIYHCYGGTHSSVTAASIHLGLLPADRVPCQETFWEIPLYDRQQAEQHGHIFFMGIDELGHEVYVTARRSRSQVLEELFMGLAGIFGIPSQSFILVNVMHKVNLTMMFGGFLSRRWGFIRVGRPVVTLGTQKAYFRVAKLVRDVKSRVGGYDEKNNLLQRQQVSPGRSGRCHPYGKSSVGKGSHQQGNLEPAIYEYQKDRRG